MALWTRNIVQLGSVAGVVWAARQPPGGIAAIGGGAFGFLLGWEVGKGLASGGEGVRVGKGTLHLLPVLFGAGGALLGWF